MVQLLADYESGITARQLAETYAISKTSVQRLLHEHGVPLRHQGLAAEQVRQAITLYKPGKSVAEVASILRLSPSSVYDALISAGVQMRPAHEAGRRNRPSDRVRD